APFSDEINRITLCEYALAIVVEVAFGRRPRLLLGIAHEKAHEQRREPGRRLGLEDVVQRQIAAAVAVVADVGYDHVPGCINRVTPPVALNTAPDDPPGRIGAPRPLPHAPLAIHRIDPRLAPRVVVPQDPARPLTPCHNSGTLLASRRSLQLCQRLKIHR